MGFVVFMGARGMHCLNPPSAHLLFFETPASPPPPDRGLTPSFNRPPPLHSVCFPAARSLILPPLFHFLFDTCFRCVLLERLFLNLPYLLFFQDVIIGRSQIGTYLDFPSLS